ncbi:MAG TPA: hypothetical protein DHN33_08830, partial [Eubacteriaceae bacterium]|nr:hypothetical protein [Eubacteriaceae bacterium]
IATGRVHASAAYYAKQLKTNAPVISCNGALVKKYNDSRAIRSYPIQKDRIAEVIDLIETFHTMYYQVSTENTYYFTKMNKGIEKYMEWNKTQKPEDRISIRPIEEFSTDKKGQEVYKIFVSHEKTENNDLHRFLDEMKHYDFIRQVRSMETSIDIIHHTVDKSKALEDVCEHLGISFNEVMAIGDQDNDVGMLKKAALGIAMGNATDEAKKAANAVVGDNQSDGVAEAIEKYLL